MKPSDAALAVLESIEATGKDYLIVGAFAVAAWGIVRSTQDADFVVAMGGQDLDDVLRRLPGELRLQPQARMELFTGTMRWVLDVADVPFKIEIFLLAGDPHHVAMFARKQHRSIPILRRAAWIPAAEDLIIQKLRWARLKDLSDVEAVLGIQHHTLDYQYIETWCAAHGTLERFRELRATIPTGL